MATKTSTIQTIGTQDGIEHANTLSQEGADADTLRACSLPSNDWGTSSSEAWYFASRKHGLRDTDANRTAYCEAYEVAARKRCAELAEEE